MRQRGQQLVGCPLHFLKTVLSQHSTIRLSHGAILIQLAGLCPLGPCVVSFRHGFPVLGYFLRIPVKDVYLLKKLKKEAEISVEDAVEKAFEKWPKNALPHSSANHMEITEDTSPPRNHGAVGKDHEAGTKCGS